MKGWMFNVLAIVIVGVVCLSVVVFVLNNVPENLIISDKVYSEVDFLLEVNLSDTVFNVGDTISGNVTLTNNCGKTVKFGHSWSTPGARFLDGNEPNEFIEPDILKLVTLKAGDKLTTDFSYEAVKSGTYTLHTWSSVVINKQVINSEKDIAIEIK